MAINEPFNLTARVAENFTIAQRHKVLGRITDETELQEALKSADIVLAVLGWSGIVTNEPSIKADWHKKGATFYELQIES